MTITYCNCCGMEIEKPQYNAWSISLLCNNDPSPLTKIGNERIARDLCEACVQPIIDIIKLSNGVPGTG